MTNKKRKVSVVIDSNPYDFATTDLFAIGKRKNNPKRDFLFISKLLGKHLPVNPDIVKATGYVLAGLITNHPSSVLIDFLKKKRYLSTKQKEIVKEELNKAYDTKSQNVLVIGFCETATALGYSVAMALKNSSYISTTREVIDTLVVSNDMNKKDSYHKVSIKNVINFEEEHSHATSHHMYSSENGIKKLQDIDEIILVDDEITTGNTALNIIHEFNKKFPHIKKYTVLSILNWMDSEFKKRTIETQKNKLNIEISFESLVEGHFKEIEDDYIENPNYNDIIANDYESIKELPLTNENIGYGIERLNILESAISQSGVQFYKNTGRFDILDHKTIEENDKLIEVNTSKIINAITKKIGKNQLQQLKNILVVGDGENIYIPSKVASVISDTLNINVDYKSTTRSPVAIDNDFINDQYRYINKTNTELYLYNKKMAEDIYDLIIFIPEIKTNYTLSQKCLNLCL